MDFVDRRHSPVAALVALGMSLFDARRPSRSVAGYACTENVNVQALAALRRRAGQEREQEQRVGWTRSAARHCACCCHCMLLVTQFMHRLMRDDRIELAEPNGPCDVFEVHEQLSSAPDVWPHLFARQMMHGTREIEHCVFGGRDRVQNAASQEARSR